MADSVQLQAVDAIETALKQASITLHAGTPQEKTVTKPSGLTVHRFRQRPIERDDLPSQVVYIVNRPKPNYTDAPTGLATKVVHVAVESRVELSSPSSEPADDALDPLISWAVQVIMADETLGGVVTGPIEEGESAWDAMDAGRAFAGNMTVFEIQYDTRRNDPELAA